MNLNSTQTFMSRNGGLGRPSTIKLFAGALFCFLTVAAQLASAQCLPRNRSALDFTSDLGTLAQLVSVNNPITPITYNTARASGATFTGLPNGVTGTWVNNAVTISGTPTESGIFAWTVKLTGGCELVPTSGAGVITVAPLAILTATTTEICGNGSTTISIENPKLIGFAHWQWYSGSCGGTKIGTGTSITVSPNATTQYFVRREGLLVTLPACASITIAVSTPQNWYLDADNDGYYTGAPVLACSSPGQGYKTNVTGGNDCDDSKPSVNPGAREVCGNSIDDNCNGLIDENCCSGIIISVPRAALIWETIGAITKGEITVSLNRACSSPVSANWSFVDGTFVNHIAIAGQDFVAASGTVVFAPGETQKTIILEVLSDGLVKDYEFVNIVFSNPINARTENGRALIGSLDTYPCRAEPVPTYIEGNSLNLQAAVPNQQGILLSRPAPTNTRMVEYIMQLNKPYPEMVSVAYRTADNSAKAGLDYVAKSGVVTFAPNQTSATIMLEIITDDVQEIPQREGFFLILTQPNKLGCNGPEQYAAIFIMDDDNGTPRGLRSAVRANDVNPTATSTSKIWPNPVQSRLNVTLNAPQNENVTLQLVNAQGKIVKQMNTQVQSKLGNALTIGVGDLPQGLYKLLVTGQTFRETRSVMIQR